jgi:hypothetical protein
LLLLDNQRSAEAEAQFTMLGNSSDDALRLYSQAMIAILNTDFDAAREKLAEGLLRPSTNPSLSGLMQRLLDRLSQRDRFATSGAAPEAEANQLLMGAYRHVSG